MSKSRKIMTVVIGLMSFMMTYVMLIQFNTIKKNDTEEIEIMRETELKETLANYKEKYEETQIKLNEVKEKIEEYKQDEKSEEDAVKLLEEDVKEANMLLGKTDVSGEGIIITMESYIRYDEEESIIIEAKDLIELITELKIAGAEAISINGERIVAKSDIFDVGNFIYINGERTTSPYEIKVIGDKKYLQSALSIKGGYIDTRGFEISVEVPEQKITIGKYKKEMTLNYIKE